MEKRWKIGLIVFFLLIINSVPITQMVIELSRGERIQIVDLLEDTFLTPFFNANVLNHDAQKVALISDSIIAALHDEHHEISADTNLPVLNQERNFVSPLIVSSMIDNALLVTSQMRKTVCSVNRHVKLDTLNKKNILKHINIGKNSFTYLLQIDSLSEALNYLANHLHSDEPTGHKESIAQIQKHLDCFKFLFSHKTVWDAPALIFNNLSNIYWGNAYLRPFEKEIESLSIFAQKARQSMLLARYLVFHDLGEKGILGKKGWYFYKNDVDYLVKPYITDKRSVIVDPNDMATSDNPIKIIVNFKKQLEKMGIDLIVMIVPVKASIYPEMLSSRMNSSQAGTFSHSLRSIEELRKEGVDVVDLFHEFAEERKNDSTEGDSLYLQKDTHWKTRSIRLSAQKVAQKIRSYPWYSQGELEYVIDTVFAERIGDIGTMTTLQNQQLHELSLAFIPEHTKCFQISSVERDSGGVIVNKKIYKDEYRKSKILILGDSFSRIFQTDEPRGAGWIANLAYELQQPCASIVNDGGASTIVRQTLARKKSLLENKKVVVWEFVERDLRYGNEGWKEISLTDYKE
jgi:hypothetical protein